MTNLRKNTRPGVPHASRVLLLSVIHVACVFADQSRPAARLPAPSARDPITNLKFTHLTTEAGLSQGYVTAILQDRRGFMWFATRDGLNRYDGNSFVVYKHNPEDPFSLSSNFIQDLAEDDHGFLWISTNTGANKFDPVTERFTRYLHDPKDPDSIAGTYITRIVRDRRGCLWFGTQEAGVDEYAPTTGKFTHYRNDSDGQVVGRVNDIIEDAREDIWFTGDRGLFHLNRRTGQITRPTATGKISADSLFADSAGNLWMAASSPIPALVRYDPQTEHLTRYPLGLRAASGIASTIRGGSVNSKLVADGQNGLWVPSSEGLYYFDWRAERFTRAFQHEESNRDSLDSSSVLSVYQDRGGVLWVGTENAGLNLLNFRQEQFVHYMHRPSDPNTISPGRVKAIFQDRNGVLWVGFFPRVLDRIDRDAGEIIHNVPKAGSVSSPGQGTNVNAIWEDTSGFLWIGGGGSGLDRFDQRTGRFRHYRHDASNATSLPSDNVVTIYGDRSGRMWVGGQYGFSRYDAATDTFTNYVPVATNRSSLLNWIWTIYEDRSGTLWLGSFGGALTRFDANANTFVAYTPDAHDPHKLSGGGVTSIHEDRGGTLWVGALDGLYQFNRQAGTFDRYTDSRGLPSSTIRCIQEDRSGRLWLSTQKGLSRFDPKLHVFRNYDASDGLQSNEFSDGCYQGRDGELFFGGSNGFNSLFPEQIRDNPYVAPLVITSFKIANKPVPIGGNSVLKKAIPYVDFLTLSYTQNDISFEFAALSYANSRKNRYRYKLESYDSEWTNADSKHAFASYTHLDPGKYVFRVQGSNSDGIWNEEGVSLPIVVTPPFWKTNLFRTVCIVVFVAILWTAYRLRVRQLQQAFNNRMQARVEERTRIARELHDTLLQTFQAALIQMQAAYNLFLRRPEKALETLQDAIDTSASAIAEGREAIQQMRSSTVTNNDLARALRVAGDGMAVEGSASFDVRVQGTSRDVDPILREEVYRIALEALRNAFRHAEAKAIEADIVYGANLTVRLRDDGKGIPAAIMEHRQRSGHYGLPGMRERAERIGGKLDVWSGPGAGTEIQLSIPGDIAFGTSGGSLRFRLFRRKNKSKAAVQG